MWLNACGKLPSSSPVAESTSSAEQADVVGVAGGALEHLGAFGDPTGEGERVGEPEGAEQERALLPVEPVHAGAGVIAMNQTAGVGELTAHGVDRGQHPWVLSWQEADDGQQQDGGVEVGAAEGLGERTLVLVPAVLFDAGPDLRRSALPLRHMVVGLEQVRERDGAVERDPAHHLRVHEVPRLAADLPDAVVRLVPARRGRVGEAHQEVAGVPAQHAELVAKLKRRVEQLAVHVELRLVPGAVADPDRRAVPPARQVRQGALGEVVLAADAEHDLQRPVRGRTGGGAGHEVEELDRLVRARSDPQRLHGEARVTDPGVAVVPVAFAADLLGQRGGRCGDDGTGGLVGQRLQHPPGVMHQVAPRPLVALVQLATSPATPATVSSTAAEISSPVRIAGVAAPRAECSSAKQAPSPEAELEAGVGVVTLHVEGDRARQREPVRAAGRDETSVDDGGDRCDQAVLRARPKRPRPPARRPCVQITVRASRWGASAPRACGSSVSPSVRRVAQLECPRRGVERRQQHHAAGDVLAFHPEVGVRADRPVPRLVVEDGGEDRGTVEPGQAQPVDRTAG